MKKTIRISFNGKTYDVVAELLDDVAPDGSPPASLPGVSVPTAATPAYAAAAPAPAGAPGAEGAGQIPSPLAGKVVSIDAAVGARVKAGQAVVTLEAMKMNTIVSSSVEGIVASVHVNPGDSVGEGQLLVTLR